MFIRIVLLGCSLVCTSTLWAQSPSSLWVNIRDFGAKGDGVSDDTEALRSAILAAVKRGPLGGNTVYFPPSSGSYVVGPIDLPPVGNTWIQLYIDAAISLKGTINMESGYSIYGAGGGQLNSFSRNRVALINVAPFVNPAIRIARKNSVRLENLSIQYMSHGADGIVIDDLSAWVTLKNVFVSMDQGNTTGIPLKIRGGFGYEIQEGSFASSVLGTAPSVLFEPDPSACNNTGLAHFRGTVFAGHAIELRGNCGLIDNLDFDDVLYESAVAPFLTINSGPIMMVLSIRIRNLIGADVATRPFVAIVDVHGSRVFSIKVIDGRMDGDVITSGDRIQNLQVWAPFTDGVTVAQADGYILYLPSKIVSTMPIVQPQGRLGRSAHDVVPRR